MLLSLDHAGELPGYEIWNVHRKIWFPDVIYHPIYNQPNRA
jgi:hypothetical protein